MILRLEKIKDSPKSFKAFHEDIYVGSFEHLEKVDRYIFEPNQFNDPRKEELLELILKKLNEMNSTREYVEGK